ncbi:efflux RND transporter periplasmic adaptor subunit [Acidithiobacillus sp. CV18-2]|uniref:Efflux RND transporter periplasmic adaptor subunit n=1 Tax=Igneacidithiobacillus copahuensis TaxID=2724909 RepID=A0AAE2YNV0_9PROT|nr:efflux RND transporter periplasmic adaptor subunit [Acidithiobacillus sp. CV18-3]MBU2757527.1 efflux RND transporter periplasmic adaptor subunit [Acidithiobacillus sp. BN09-2]MBU2778255.1 efflux RND transporter periplasmic adaptor subunit [Acidithiobacillus sp. CV18-2]MBU2787452.1 efflux RND transporter periplasmic adaptor subunit [Igneacidithiobacillus copahuensis]MBU2797471.1 efflux RND transporter periplasmic adaptor subunit [Acidithiobacillus sp. VAN18-2]MBU2799691.1 efflux RND transpor
MKKQFLTVAIILSLGLAGCGQKPPHVGAVGESVQAQTLTLAAGKGLGYETVPGTVMASQQIQLGSRLSGYLRGLQVHVGESVRAGQLLFQVDPADVDSQVAQAQASLAQAEANFADAQSNYDRFKKLYEAQAIPQKQWDQVQSQYQMAKAQVAAARAGTGSAAAQLRYARVTAPFAGVITQKYLQNGDLVAPGHPVLALANPQQLEVDCSVGTAAFATLHVGQALVVDNDGKALTATVRDLVPVADPVTHSHLVKLSLPAGSDIQAGAFVQVQIPQVGETTTLRIPQGALLNRAGIPGVFVVNSQGVAEYRMVRPGQKIGDQVQILAGLSAGERIVVSNIEAVDNGDRIESTGAAHG